MKHKITRKQLKQPDEFISVTQRSFIFIRDHSRKIATGGVILLVVFLALFLFQKWQKNKDDEAYGKFSLALEAYQTGEQTADYKNALEKLDEVITKFPGTSWGKLALLYKGNIHLRLGAFDEAGGAYNAFLQKAGKEKTYRLLALEGFGYAYEGKKDYQKALGAYQKIIEEGESFQLANAYLSVGRCYEKLGKNKEASENYKSFLKVSQKSQMTNAVLRKISSLEKSE
ncbi:MAG TPA: tetratricopeptide repeat protein [bacterium]|nr:tetratricopeptide repeat protein [bacterium]